MSSFWDFSAYIFSSLSDLFLVIYSADKRPKARQLTVGCFTVFLITTALVGLYLVVRS